MLRRTLILLSALGLLMLAATGLAGAATVTVGSPLTLKFGGALGSSPSGTWANSVLTEPGAHTTSPVDGAVIAWTMTGNYSANKPFELRVLRPGEGGAYTAVGTSAAEKPSGGTQTFATDLPIKAGDLIGLNVNESGYIGQVEVAGGLVVDWFPKFGEGATLAPPYKAEKSELGFNATVQPAPTISAVSAATGPAAGGTSVTISGTDFEGASAVDFGPTAALSATVSSEGQIVAVSPPGTGSVPVTVTTVAGTATAPQPFVYVSPPAPPAPPAPAPPIPPAKTCTVPNLDGKSLKAAKKKIAAAHCKVGKLTKKEGATAKDGKVTKQTPKAAAVVPAATKVKLTIAP